MDKPHWLDKPRNVKLLWRGFLVALALSVLAQLFVDLHAQFAIEGVFGFAAWYGFATCILMIVVAKLLGLWLKRPESYYDERHE